MFSPDDKYIITGAGATSKGGKGKLMLMAKDDLSVVKALEVDSTPVKVFWHSKINQVGPCRDVVLFNTLISLRSSRDYQVARYVCCTPR